MRRRGVVGIDINGVGVKGLIWTVLIRVGVVVCGYNTGKGGVGRRLELSKGSLI